MEVLTKLTVGLNKSNTSELNNKIPVTSTNDLYISSREILWQELLIVLMKPLSITYISPWLNVA